MKKIKFIWEIKSLPYLLFNALLLIFLLTSSSTALTAGLGNLAVGSYLGQPFKAEIELVAVKDSDIPAITAKLASPEAFQQAGLKYLDYHAALSVAVAQRVDGRPYLQIFSSRGINEPFINLLIELNSPTGRLLREYTVLLDPAETQLMPQVPVARNDAADTVLNQTPAKRITSTEPVPSDMQQSYGSDGTEASYGPVVPGDNLTRIVRQITPDNIDLNQMLVALYRANRDAFIEKNMNLLRVGAILRIPAHQEITSISPREAVREVRTQTTDWHSYRQRVADMASGVSGAQSQQSVSGKITKDADNIALIENTESDEVLRLSKGELLQDKQSIRPESTEDLSQQRLHMMEEDAIAKERTLQEANERVTQLEQNVSKLQRLLQLKNDGLNPEQFDQILEPASIPVDPANTPSSETLSTPVLESVGQEPVSNSIMPEFTIPAQPVTAPSPAAILQPDLTETDEFAWLDTLIAFAVENIMLIGGALAALLATWLGISIFRHRQEQAEMNLYDNIDNYDATGTTDSSETAAEYLKEAPDQSGFHRETGKSESGETVSNPAFFFGKKLDENPLTEDTSATKYSQTESQDSTELSRIFQEEIKIGTDADERENNSEQATDIITEETMDKWRFPDGDILEIEEPTDNNIFSKDTLAEKPVISEDSHQIDFEPTHTDPGDQVKHEASGLNESFTRIDLNLGDESVTASAPTLENSEETGGDQWQEVATKIDLAKAYLEMEDKEGAREILQEVLQEGDAEQQATARTMLSEIDG
ncbi:MAG: FimV/HubP family polar landmark protein [Nitrosomonas sp.]|nr:FimV/HubP family polar landmark protein [Nitrosomonas sp.]